MAVIDMDFAMGNGEHYEETVLWTNSNPTSNQGDVTIELSDSMSNYDYIKFVVRRATSDSSETEDIYSVSDVRKSTGVNGTWYICLMSFVSGTGTYCRRIQYISDTSIKALTPYVVGSSASGVDATILIKVVGLKKVGGNTTVNVKTGTFDHVDGGGDTTVVCGFRPKYVAITKSSKGRIGIYDERISTTNSVTAISTPAYNENSSIIQVQLDGFIVPSTAVETGMYYYFAVG